MGQIIKKALDHNYAFWICLCVAIILLVASFLLPPIGIVDNSVLLAVSELWGFGALGAFSNAIAKGMGAKVSKGDTSLEVRKNNRGEE